MRSLGYGQTWKDVTASRFYGTTYYNFTPRPIFLEVCGIANSGIGLTLYKNGQSVQVFGNSTATTEAEAVASIILMGESYSVGPSSGITPSTWWETS